MLLHYIVTCHSIVTYSACPGTDSLKTFSDEELSEINDGEVV